MTNIEKIEKQLKDTKEELKAWKERLYELEVGLLEGRWSEEEKKKSEDLRDKLEKEKNELVESKKSGRRFIKRHYVVEKVMNNLHKKIYKKLFSIHSISFIYLFNCVSIDRLFTITNFTFFLLLFIQN